MKTAIVTDSNSGLSGSLQSAKMLAEDYGGNVQMSFTAGESKSGSGLPEALRRKQMKKNGWIWRGMFLKEKT